MGLPQTPIASGINRVVTQTVFVLYTPFQGVAAVPAPTAQMIVRLLEAQGLARAELGVLGCDGSGLALVAAIAAQRPESTVRSIDLHGVVYFERRFNGPEQSIYDYPYGAVVVATPVPIYRSAVRSIGRHIRGSPLIILTADGSPIGSVFQMDIDDSNLAKPKVGVVFPGAGSGRFDPPFMNLMPVFGIQLDTGFKEPYFDPRTIQSIRGREERDTLFLPRGDRIDQAVIDRYYVDLLHHYPGLYKYCFIHHPVSMDVLSEFPDIDFIALIRDPRDVVNSLYHRLMRDGIKGEFDRLTTVSQEEGLSIMIEGFDFLRKDYFLKWPSIRKMACDFVTATRLAHVHVVRFEDIRYQPRQAYRQLLSALHLDPSPFVQLTDELLDQIIHTGTFEAQTGGQIREGGDRLECFRFADGRLTGARKGERGDWRNHFSPAVQGRIKECIGDELVALGYEKDRDW